MGRVRSPESMLSNRADATGCSPRRHPCRRAVCSALLVLTAACGGPLSERSYANLSGTIPVGQGIEVIRIEIENGSVQVDRGTDGSVQVAGGVRRAADTPEQLAMIERVPLDFTGAPDPRTPSTLVIRAPKRPGELPDAVMAFEVGFRIPPTLRLEILIAANGKATIKNREAATRVETGRGDLRFENCAGGVTARTGKGVLIAWQHRGNLDVKTLDGDMQAFIETAGNLIQLVTQEGTIQCHVPPDLEYDLDARADVGHIGNGFGLTPERVGSYGAALTGKSGSARTKVILRTGSGHLSIAPHQTH